MNTDYTEIKQIIAKFIKKDISEINENTLIDRSVIQGSILIHRMYAELTDNGYKIENYNDIKTFGQLIKRLNSDKNSTNEIIRETHTDTDLADTRFLVGIDIEKVSNFKEVTDYREDNFYTQNFTQQEIAHCILQANPLQSFAGLFAAKEAIVKADNQLKNKNFNSIEIKHDLQGRPLYRNFQISISHTDEHAIAIAIKNPGAKNDKIDENNENIDSNNAKIWKLLTIISLIISFTLAFYILFKF